ncbi:MAG: hypothetical protein M0R37_12525 [Bacteroidales bacterium]|nr:hypothetical protein [Bacteroidales bacterium]
MYIRRQPHVLIEETLDSTKPSYGTPRSANSALEGLEPRPADRYAYGSYLQYELDFTATPAGGAIDCEPEKIVQVLKSVFLSYAGLTPPRHNNISGLDIVRLSQQIDENLAPDVVDSYLPIVALDPARGAQAVHLCIIDPLGIQWPKGTSGKETGLVPVSELADGADLRVTCIGTTVLDAAWSIGDIDLKVTLMTVEVDEPLEHVQVIEESEDYTTGKAVLPGTGERLYSAIAITDDADGAFTQPVAMGVQVDGDMILANRRGADLVVEEDMHRLVGVNDFLPAICPLITLSGRRLDEALPVRDKIILHNANDSHAGAYRVLVRYSKKLDRNTQRAIQLKHKVPAELVDRFLGEMEARPNADATIGRATVAMRAS